MILSAAIALALQAAPALAGPTLASIEGLSPQATGDILLESKEHGPIVRVAVPERRGTDLPGTVERQLIEQTVAIADGCARRRWTATFFLGPSPEGLARLHDISAKTEVALPGPAGCSGDGYVLTQDIEPTQALAALRRLDDLRLGGAQARFECSDETDSRLCADPSTIRPTLAALSPWMVTREDGQTAFWMGAPGGVVTELRYSPARPERVTVKRYVPAPF